jgi:hypothetical protein
MAARIRKHHQEEVRARIQTSQLVNRLTDHALCYTELSANQIKAIEILLRKSIPDLSAVELSGDAENPVAISRIELVALNDSNTNSTTG